MIIKDPGFLRYDPGLKDQVPKIDIPKKAEPVFIKEKLEQILAEDPDNPLKEKLSSAVSVEISEEGKKHILENHITKRPGDEISAFTGANTTLGCLLMTFDSMEQMLDMMDHSEKWIQVVLEKEM